MHGVLLLPPRVRTELEFLVVAGYPDETCGLLLGEYEAGICRVLSQHPARNLNRERAADRFELDPLDFLAAEQSAAATGVLVVGVWHSHPDHPARPSETDRALAWPGWSYLILSVTAGAVVDLRCWRLAGHDFIEEEVRHG
jgi:proteasome lid subunit RPN8/RPN11